MYFLQFVAIYKMQFLQLCKIDIVVVIPMDIVDRLFELVDAQYRDQKDFAKAIEVDPSHISRWRNRKTTSFQRRLPQIAEVLGTTTEYLLTGEGPKRKKKIVSNSDTISEDDIKAAFWGGDQDLSPEDLDAMWSDVKRFADFVAQQKKREKQQND